MSVRPELSAAEVREGMQWGFPQVHDRRGEIARTYDVVDTPTWFFLDRDHRLRAKIIGVPTEGEIAAALRLATAQ